MTENRIPPDIELDSSGIPLDYISEAEAKRFDYLSNILALVVGAMIFALFYYLFLKYSKVGFVSALGFSIISFSALAFQLPRLFSGGGNKLRADRKFNCCLVQAFLIVIGAFVYCPVLNQMHRGFWSGVLKILLAWIAIPVIFNVSSNVLFHFYDEKQKLEGKKRQVPKCF